MEITFKNLQKKVPLNPPQILKITKIILRREGIHQASLSIVFVTCQRIKALNKKFLHRNYVTDVLAFDLSDGVFSRKTVRQRPKVVVGEIIISTDAAIKNIKTYKTELSEELALYVIHGILHLLGFDDHSPQDIRKMRNKEQELLDYLGTRVKKILC